MVRFPEEDLRNGEESDTIIDMRGQLLLPYQLVGQGLISGKISWLKLEAERIWFMNCTLRPQE